MDFLSSLLGNVWPFIAGLGALVLILFGVKKAGKDEQKVKEQAETIRQNKEFQEHVTDAVKAESPVRDDIAAGKLREPDRYKRKPKKSV